MDSFEAFGDAFRRVLTSPIAKPPALPFPGDKKRPEEDAVVLRKTKKEKIKKAYHPVFSTEKAGIEAVSHFKTQYLYRSWQVEATENLRGKDAMLPFFLWRARPVSGRQPYPSPLAEDYICLQPLRVQSSLAPIVFLIEEELVSRLYAYSEALGRFKSHEDDAEPPERDALKEACDNGIFDADTHEYEIRNPEKVLVKFAAYLKKNRSDAKDYPWSADVQLKAENLASRDPRFDVFFSKDVTFQNSDALEFAEQQYAIFQSESDIGAKDVGALVTKQNVRLISYTFTRLLLGSLMRDLGETYSGAYLESVRSCQRMTMRLRAKFCVKIDKKISVMFEEFLPQMHKICSEQYRAYVEAFLKPFAMLDKDNIDRQLASAASEQAKTKGLQELEIEHHALILSLLRTWFRDQLGALVSDLKTKEAQAASYLLNTKTGDDAWNESVDRYKKRHEKEPKEKTKDARVEFKNLIKRREKAWVGDGPHAVGRGLLAQCDTRELLHQMLDVFLVSAPAEVQFAELKKDSDEDIGGRVKAEHWGKGRRTVSFLELERMYEWLTNHSEKKVVSAEYSKATNLLRDHVMLAADLCKRLGANDPYYLGIKVLLDRMWANNPKATYVRQDDGSYERTGDVRVTYRDGRSIFRRIRGPPAAEEAETPEEAAEAKALDKLIVEELGEDALTPEERAIIISDVSMLD